MDFLEKHEFYGILDLEDYIFMNDKENKKPNLSSSKGKAGRDVSDPTLKKVLEKIDDAESVLVALSNDPSVDEIAAAMGLSMVLDEAGKHVTAIYSGKTPNVLQFLKPEERFETGTESLQDFVIAMNKDKADLLLYKIDGDFVKVYVTPYKTTISGDDIEFSRGDYNVDLVISLNVPAATELDAALKEHGRIMHDATSINVTNGAAGKFGDVEWVDAKASSISEMVSKLAFELVDKMDAATATALLTGLVAATDRFKNPATTPDAMVLAAKLRGAGADQQLVVLNVHGEVVFEGEGAGAKSVVVPEAEEATDESGEDVPADEPKDASHFSISHGEENEAEMPVETGAGKPVLENSENDGPEAQEQGSEAEASAEQSSANVEANVPTEGGEVDPVKAAMASALGPMAASVAPANNGTVAGVDVALVPENADGYAGSTMADQILNNLEQGKSNVGATDYGKMIDEALDEPLPGEGGIQVGQQGANGAQVNTQDVDKVDVPQGNPMAGIGAMPTPTPSVNEEEEAMNIIKAAQAEANAPLPGMTPGGELPKIITGGGMTIDEQPVGMDQNPAMGSAPAIGAAPEMGGVPEMNFGAEEAPAGAPSPMSMNMTSELAGATPESNPNPMPMPGQDTLPPPVTPMPDFGAMPPSGMPMGGEQGVGAMPVENTIPVPEPVPMPDVTVQPDMNAPIAAMSLPQVPEVPAVQAPEAPADPTAFKIPGIHT
ncbi:hypothetical protein IJG96_02730 [Candidatus Saccharibacteria bacterium]|nr:hypothetical protein [Candidatus Saccharibacteria bacterium]